MGQLPEGLDLTYAVAARNHARPLRRIEAWLETIPSGETVSRSDLRQAAGADLSSEDALLIIAEGLVTLGVLQATEGRWRVDNVALHQTADLRRGIHIGVGSSISQSSEAAILARAPDAASRAVHDAIDGYSGDLRFELLDLIASAREELLLASPFWDDETVGDFRMPLQGRLDSGIRVILLGRESGGPAQALWNSLVAQPERCQLYGWYEVSEATGTIATFHLKALIQDHGRAAYLGSANFTASSLRSRMELGLRLTGAPANSLSRIMYALISGAKRIA